MSRVLELFSKSPVVSFSSVRRIVGDDYAKQVVSNLAKQGKIHRLARGCYSMHDDPTLLVLCFRQAYLGLQSAMSTHGLWGQETIPVIITAQKARTGLRRVCDTNVLVRRAQARHVFGYDYILEGEHHVPVSDVEKTFIDMVVFRQPLPDEEIKAFRGRIDKARLKSYLREYSEKVSRTVLNRYAGRK